MQAVAAKALYVFTAWIRIDEDRKEREEKSTRLSCKDGGQPKDRHGIMYRRRKERTQQEVRRAKTLLGLFSVLRGNMQSHLPLRRPSYYSASLGEQD